MAPSTKLEHKLEGIENLRAWKYKIGIILEENDLAKYIKEEVAEPEEDEAKEKHKKDLIRAIRIIVDSIKDHLIPQGVRDIMENPVIFWQHETTGWSSEDLSVHRKYLIQ